MFERNHVKKQTTKYVNNTTFACQDQLPRLPIPDLHSTISKFLRTLEPIVSQEDYNRAKSLAKDFIKAGGAGEKLQRLLVQLDQKEQYSWLEKMWNSWAYMDYKDSVVINVSPAFYLDPTPSGPWSQEQRSSAWIWAIARFKRELDDERLAPDEIRGQLQCMSFYRYIFSACRIPHTQTDYITTYTPEESSHVAVFYKNAVYRLETRYPGTNDILSVPDFERQIRKIKDDANGKPIERPIGLLTSENRVVWAKTRDKLLKHPKNAETLNTIESAMTVICLDDYSPETLNQGMAYLHHGLGGKYMSGNRWWDKTQFVVFGNGKGGFIQEHSPYDGFPLTLLSDRIFEEIEYDSYPPGPKESHPTRLHHPQRLSWEYPRGIDNDLSNANSRITKDINNLSSCRLQFTEFGKDAIKSIKMSPDAFVQMCFQLTYYMIHKKFDPAYESVSMRHFRRGRTETGRSTSVEACAFVRTYLDPNATKDQKIKALKAGISAHVKYAKEAKKGGGIDRHLLALQQLASQNDINHAFLKDPTISRSCHWNMSTSCLTCNHSVIAFGPVVHDGYGIWYGIRKKQLEFNVTSLKSCKETISARAFAETLRKNLVAMRTMVLSPAKL